MKRKSEFSLLIFPFTIRKVEPGHKPVFVVRCPTRPIAERTVEKLKETAKPNVKFEIEFKQ